MIDAHCHLDTRVWGDDAGVDAVIARAREAGVVGMIAIGSGYGFESADRAVAVAMRHPDVRAAVGLHPHDAKDATTERLADLFALAGRPEVVGVGEMGLDYHYDNSPREEQRSAFRDQLAAAREIGKPIIIHDRESGGETLTLLDEARAWDQGVMFHCYTGDVAMMEAIVARGGHVSIPGIVTFKNAGTMREVAALAPGDRLHIETDSPFLTPIPFRGQRNEPRHVALVAARVAELRGMVTGELAAMCAANTRRFFRWPGGPPSPAPTPPPRP